jgi:acetolactate synthase-1/2/3 large subunit
MVGISRPVVKHSFLVKQTEDIPGVLKKAFWLAASGRPGPVVVDLPKDILNPAKNCRTSGRIRSACARITRRRRAIKGRLNAPADAGGGKNRSSMSAAGRLTQCEPQLYNWLEKLKLPVASSLMGLGAFRHRISRRWGCWACTAPMKPT